MSDEGTAAEGQAHDKWEGDDQSSASSWANTRKCVTVSCSSVLLCVAVCCSVLQSVAECCSVLQCVAECCSVLQSLQSLVCVALYGRTNGRETRRVALNRGEIRANVIRYVAGCCRVLQSVAGVL